MPVVVAQLAAYGDVVSAVPTFVHESAPDGDRWNWADATPEPPSAELDVTLTVPRTLAVVGAVTAPVGSVLSTRMLLTDAEVVTLPATSVVTTRRS